MKYGVLFLMMGGLLAYYGRDAVAQLRKARPGIRLNQRQAALVARDSSTPAVL